MVSCRSSVLMRGTFSSLLVSRTPISSAQSVLLCNLELQLSRKEWSPPSSKPISSLEAAGSQPQRSPFTFGTDSPELCFIQSLSMVVSGYVPRFFDSLLLRGKAYFSFSWVCTGLSDWLLTKQKWTRSDGIWLWRPGHQSNSSSSLLSGGKPTTPSWRHSGGPWRGPYGEELRPPDDNHVSTASEILSPVRIAVATGSPRARTTQLKPLPNS